MPQLGLAIVAYALTGGLTGLLSGLLGVGGGIVVVPLLVEIFQYQGMSQVHLVHLAVGSSLGIMVLTTLSAAFNHHRRGSVNWRLFKWMAPPMMVGAFLGTQIADHISGGVLKVLFGLFLFVVTLLLFSRNSSQRTTDHLSSKVVGLSGLGIGVLAGMLGIGGGLILVPFLARHAVPMKEAAGTTAACMLPNAVVGSFGVILAGMNEVNLPPYAIGYIYLPALFSVAIVSVLTVPWGVALAHRLPTQQIKRVFAGVLVLVALRLLWTSGLS
jgi:uncharacterized protein